MIQTSVSNLFINRQLS